MAKTQAQQQAAGYGRVRQKKRTARLYPGRAHYDLRKAAANLGLRVRACEAEIYNADAKGKSGRLNGAPQWIDVLASRPNLGLVALDIKEMERKEYSQRFQDEKRATLTKRGIPYFTIAPVSLFEIQAALARWLREQERK